MHPSIHLLNSNEDYICVFVGSLFRILTRRNLTPLLFPFSHIADAALHSFADSSPLWTLLAQDCRECGCGHTSVFLAISARFFFGRAAPHYLTEAFCTACKLRASRCAQVSNCAFRCARVSQPCIPVSNRAFTCDRRATGVPELQRTSAGCLSVPSVAAASQDFLRRLVDGRAVLRWIGSALQQDHFICRC